VLEQEADNREALECLVIICLQSERAEAAEQHLQHLVETYPAEPLYCERLATLLFSRGRASEAIACYRVLLNHYPELNNSRYNLARLLKRAGFPELALEEYEECLRRGVENAEEVYTNISVIHTEAHDNELAETALRTALKINLDYTPALYNLALMQEETGDWPAARALFVNILDLEPLHPGALSHIADAETLSDPLDPLLRAMKRASRQDGLAKEAQENLLYALGKVHDDLKRYSDAFEYYMRANQYSRLRVGDYDRSGWERAIDAVIQHCDQPWLEAITPVSEAPLIFICGMFRSGSTLLEQIVAAHPAVVAGGEIGYLRSRLLPYPAAMLALDSNGLRQLGDGYVDYLSATFGSEVRVTDKRPDNFLSLGLIKALFPNACILHSTRQAKDNCLSIYFQSLDKSLSYANDPLDIAHYYLQYQRLMNHWRQLFGGNILDVSYESLVVNPRDEIAGVLEFLGLDWDEACLEFTATNTRVRTASLHQVRRPLYQSSAGRWKNYAGSIAGVVEYLDSGKTSLVE
jgi:tetratricopeptide (TPR) repeat protein